MMRQDKKTLTLKTLDRSNVWDMQENDVFRLLDMADKDIDLKDNIHYYFEIIKSAFDIEEIKMDNPKVIAKYEERGFKVEFARTSKADKGKVAVKKRSITRVADITYDNIQHISTNKLLEILEGNFGGGWDSLQESTKNIINRGFDVSTTTLPMDRLHKSGGMYDKRVNEGYEVLEIKKGTWIEAIFAKKKPEVEIPVVKKSVEAPSTDPTGIDKTQNFDPDYIDETDDNDSYNDPELDEESYHTTYDISPDEDLNLEAEDITDDDTAF